jgi:hypothetical protein
MAPELHHQAHAVFALRAERDRAAAVERKALRSGGGRCACVTGQEMVLNPE